MPIILQTSKAESIPEHTLNFNFSPESVKWKTSNKCEALDPSWANKVTSPFLINCRRLRVDLYHPPNPETFRIKSPNMAIPGCPHNAALCQCFDKSTSYQHTQNTLTWRFSTQLQTDNSCPVVLHSLLSMDTKPSSRQPVSRT